MSKHLTPVQVCERIFGDLPEVARIAGKHEKSGYAWRRPSAGRDAGDLPSARIMRRLHAHAAARGLPLRAAWLIWGATDAEIEAAMTEAASGGCEAAA